MAAGELSDKMISDMEAQIKQRCGTELLHADIRRCLLNVYGHQTLHMSTVRRWLVCFSSNDSNMKDKPHSRQCTTDTPQNEEHFNQLTHMFWQIMDMELCMELNIYVNALEMVAAVLEYHKNSSKWFPRVLT